MLLVLLASFLGSFGAVFLKSGAGRLHRQSRFAGLQLPADAGACSCFLLSSYFFVSRRAQGELTVLYPMVSVRLRPGPLVWSRIFFGEPFTRTKFVGLGHDHCRDRLPVRGRALSERNSCAHPQTLLAVAGCLPAARPTNQSGLRARSRTTPGCRGCCSSATPISIGYTLAVRNLLAGTANIHPPPPPTGGPLRWGQGHRPLARRR